MSREPEYNEWEDSECWNCGGDGYVYGCSWDWQCDTYDEGDGACLCARRCDFCNPPPEPTDAALLTDIFDKMAEVVAPLPGIPDAPGQHAGTRATESGDGDEA